MRPRLNKLLPFLGIRGKLLVAFIGLAVVPLAVLAASGLRSASQALANANADHLRLQLDSNVGHIESYLALLDANAEMFTRFVEEAGALQSGRIDPEGLSKVERMFYHFARMRPDYYQIRLLSAEGRELLRLNRAGDRVEVVPPEALQDKSDRYYFRDAMAAPDEATFFSPLDLNVERGEVEAPQQLVFRVARKVRGEGGPRGLVVMNVFGREVLDRLKLLRPDPRAEVLFAGDDGRVVREDCAGGSCEYSFGLVSEHLTGFGPVVVDALRAGETRIMVEGAGRFVSFAPIRVGAPGGGRRWSLAIVYPRERVLGPVWRMRRVATLFTALVVALALGLAVLATRELTTPIRDILHFVQGVAVGDFKRELRVETRDELEQLAGGVRRTAGALEEAQARMVRWNEDLKAEVARQVAQVETLLEAKHSMERQLRHADRLASLGMLSASLAHEVGNPLAGMKTVIQVHLREPGVSDSTRGALELILSEVDRLAGILERVTGFVRPVRAPPASVTLGEVFRRVSFLVDREARQQGVAVLLEGDGTDHPIVAEGQKLQQVLLNLIVNALQAMPGPGRVTVTVRRTAAGLEVAVADTGPGIPAEARPRVFEPFFTTKRDGTGLGLAIVHQIVTEMGGEIALESPQTGGTRVRIDLPTDLPTGAAAS